MKPNSVFIVNYRAPRRHISKARTLLILGVIWLAGAAAIFWVIWKSLR